MLEELEEWFEGKAKEREVAPLNGDPIITKQMIVKEIKKIKREIKLLDEKKELKKTLDSSDLKKLLNDDDSGNLYGMLNNKDDENYNKEDL